MKIINGNYKVIEGYDRNETIIIRKYKDLRDAHEQCLCFYKTKLYIKVFKQALSELGSNAFYYGALRVDRGHHKTFNESINNAIYIRFIETYTSYQMIITDNGGLYDGEEGGGIGLIKSKSDNLKVYRIYGKSTTFVVTVYKSLHGGV